MTVESRIVWTIGCTGCGRRIPAPPESRRFIQCKECGRRMHVLRISPANERSIPRGG